MQPKHIVVFAVCKMGEKRVPKSDEQRIQGQQASLSSDCGA
jgi:hypothetical protein